MGATRPARAGQAPKRKKGGAAMDDAAWTLFDVRRLGTKPGRRESNTASDAAKANMAHKPKKKKKRTPSGSTYA